MRALAIGLGLALSFGVASAQPAAAPATQPTSADASTTAPDHKTTKPPRGSRGKKARPTTRPGDPAAPDAAATPSDPLATRPADATGQLTDGAATARPTAAAPADPRLKPDAPGAPAAGGGKPANKTDEKAGANETLSKDNAQHPWLIGVPPAEQQAASVAFHEGNLQLNDGLFVNAVEKYNEALKHWNHPAIHYNLALALLNLDKPIEVYEHLNKAVQYGAEPLEKDKFEHAKEYLLLIEKELADIEVSCDKIGAKVSVDGKEVFIAPGTFTQKVRVGKHTFVAEKEGYNARVNAPYVGPGEKFRIELKLYTAEELTRYHRKWESSWFPYAIAGAGVAIGLGAGAMELSAQSSFNDFNSKVAACNTPRQGCRIDTPGITSLRDSGNTKRTIGYVGYGIAGAAVGTGVALLIINRQQPYQITPEQLGNEPQGSIAIAPLVSPQLAGAMVQGHF